MKYLKYTFAVVFVAAAVLAAKQAKFSVVNDPNPQWFQQGFYLGTPAKNPVSDTKNKLAKHLCGTMDWDFPAVTNGAANSLVSTCTLTDALTITGCAFTDRLALGVDQATADGLRISPKVTAASTVKLEACAIGWTDGGSANQADSGFTICCDGY